MRRILWLLVLCSLFLGQQSAPVYAQNSLYDGLDIVFLVDQSSSMGRIHGGMVPNDKLGLRFESLRYVTTLMGNYRLLVNNDVSFRMAVVNFGTASEPWRFSLSNAYWVTIAPDSRDQWTPQYAQLQQDFQQMEAEFSQRDLGGTNFLGAFETAKTLFDQIPAMAGHRLRVIIVLTDGQPSLDVPGFNVGNHMSELVSYSQRNFPEPEYRLYTIGMIDASAPYWQRLEPYWKTITNDPCTPRSCPDEKLERAGLVANNTEVGKRFDEIFSVLSGEMTKPSDAIVIEQDIFPGPLTVPPYLKSISFSYFKTDTTQQLVLTGPDGARIKPGPGVEVEGTNGPIEVVRINNPVPGRWQVATDPVQPDVNITMRSIFSKSSLESPSASQVQFAPVTIEYTLLDEYGKPLPVYSDPTYALVVTATVTAKGQSWDLDLRGDNQGVYSAEFVPVVTGQHTIYVRATSQDYEGNLVTVYDGEIGAFTVSPLQIVVKDLPQAWQQYEQQAITFEFQDSKGIPVQPSPSLQLVITIDGETLTLSPAPDGSYRAMFTPQKSGQQTIHALATTTDMDGVAHTVVDADIGRFEVLPTTRVDLQILEPAQPEQRDTGLFPWDRTPLTLRVRFQDENGNALDAQQIFAPDKAASPLSITGIEQETGDVLNIPLTFHSTSERGEFIAQTTELGIGKYSFTISGANLKTGYTYRNAQATVQVVRIRHPLHIPLLIVGIILAVAAVSSGAWLVVHQINLRKHPCRGRIVIADADGIQKFQKSLNSYGRNRIVLSRKEFPAILHLRKMEIWCESEADSNNKKVYIRAWREGDSAPLAGLDGRLLMPGSEVRLGNAPFWLYKDPAEIWDHPEVHTNWD